MLVPINWTTEFSRAFKSSKDLQNFLGWEIHGDVEKIYPVFIPYRIAEKIRNQGPLGPLARQFVPHRNELGTSGMLDPIGDREHFSAPQLIHRYPNRALFTPTSVCPINCRYCFRKNELSPKDELFQGNFGETLDYLRNNPNISEIIFTGGDPLTLSNERIEKYLQAFLDVSTLKDIRFHTRYPVILPERIDKALLEILNKFSALFRTISLVVHVNHADEFDSVSRQVLKALSALNIQVLSQSVLLKNVNDDAQTLKALIEELISVKVRPYYLHHPDQVKGGTHFYLPLARGRQIYQELRPLVPGWALPQYVVDIPGGHGKVSAFNPESYHFTGTMLGQSGELISFSEPE